MRSNAAGDRVNHTSTALTDWIAAAITHTARNPQCAATKPPVSAPSGVKPHASARWLVSTRPSRGAGVKRWRLDWEHTFQISTVAVSRINTAPTSGGHGGTRAISRFVTTPKLCPNRIDHE